jgi:cbb3-type cytochrome oxidase maturation protein
MSVLYVSIPVALVMAAAAVAAFWWSVRGGQFDDLETPPYRMLFDEGRADRKTGAVEESPELGEKGSV